MSRARQLDNGLLHPGLPLPELRFTPLLHAWGGNGGHASGPLRVALVQPALATSRGLTPLEGEIIFSVTSLDNVASASGGLPAPPGRIDEGRDDNRMNANDNNGDEMVHELSVVGVPWAASQCRLCGNWYTLAKDYVRHYEDAHPVASLRFKCDRCGSLFARWHGACVHYAKCRGPVASPPRGFPCSQCERRFPTQRGLTLHRNHQHPVERNAERADVRPARVPAVRASSVWSEGEDRVLKEKYLEFAARGKKQGYSLFIATYLPLKTDKQIRDRVRTLKGHGLLPGNPRPPLRADGAADGARPVGGPLVENLGPDIVVEEGVPEAPIPPEQGTAVGPVEEGEPPHQLDDGVGEVPALHDGVAPLVEVVEDVAARPIEEAPWVMYLRGLDVGRLPLAQQIVGLIDHINGETLDSIVTQLHADLVQLGPERGAAPNRGGRPGRRAERTRRRVRIYAKTQELYRRNPSRLAELVLKDNLGDLLEEGDKPNPPVEAVAYF